MLAICVSHSPFSVARFTGLAALIGADPSTKGAGLFSAVRFTDSNSRAFMNNPGQVAKNAAYACEDACAPVKESMVRAVSDDRKKLF